MNAKPPVNTAALEADIDTHVDTGPLRHFAAAFKALNICSVLHRFFENSFGFRASSGRRDIPATHGRKCGGKKLAVKTARKRLTVSDHAYGHVENEAQQAAAAYAAAASSATHHALCATLCTTRQRSQNRMLVGKAVPRAAPPPLRVRGRADDWALQSEKKLKKIDFWSHVTFLPFVALDCSANTMIQ
jgi:hypothetical protein